jgi:hypothetical protein
VRRIGGRWRRALKQELADTEIVLYLPTDDNRFSPPGVVERVI